MFKRNVFKILAIVFFLLAGNFYFNSNKVTLKTVVKNKKISPPPTIIKGREDLTPKNQLNPIPSDSIRFNPSLTPTPTRPIQPTPTDSTKLSISLSISGSSVGSFDIPQDSNQCDVLSQALAQGKIQSLNMRYNNDMGTNAVYQINGIGKENAVWWTFKVNGQSPIQGCSYIKVNNGDNVLWEYVGN